MHCIKEKILFFKGFSNKTQFLNPVCLSNMDNPIFIYILICRGKKQIRRQCEIQQRVFFS